MTKTTQDLILERVEEQLVARDAVIKRLEALLAETRRQHAEMSEAQARVGVRLVAQRDRLLWLACSAVYWSDGLKIDGEIERTARRILAEHDYDTARIERVARMPEPVVPE